MSTISASRSVAYRRAFRDIAPILGLIVLPAFLWTRGLVLMAQNGTLAWDFHQFFYPQARDLLHGQPPATAYPPIATLLYVPLALLPRGAADITATLLMVACTAGTLRALDVRDWRCYGAAALWEPIYAATQTANLSQVLALGLALMWRWRERPLVSGALAAATIALKLFLWPVAGWLWVTGRRRAVITMLAAGAIASTAAWTVIGLSAVRHFPDLLRGNVLDNGNKPYTITALARSLGAGTTLAYTLTWTAGLTTLAAGLHLARRGKEAEGLTLTIAAALLLSPIVWTPYLTLLLIPMALTRPRFSPIWLAPLPLWLVPQVGGSTTSKILLLTCTATTFAYLGGVRWPGAAGRSVTTTP